MEKFTAKVKAGAKNESVRKEGNEFIVSVQAPAKEGRANDAVEKAIAGYLGIAPSRVRIVSGLASKKKILEIS